MSDKVNQFDDIYLGNAPELGLLRLAQSGLGWKARTVDKLFTVRDADLRKMYWIRAARNFQLRLQLRDNTIVKFDGFQRDVCSIFFFHCTGSGAAMDLLGKLSLQTAHDGVCLVC